MTVETPSYEIPPKARNHVWIFGVVGLLLLLMQVPWMFASAFVNTAIFSNANSVATRPVRCGMFLIAVAPAILALIGGSLAFRAPGTLAARLPAWIALFGGLIAIITFYYAGLF